jgi:hypothetical protein
MLVYTSLTCFARTIPSPSDLAPVFILDLFFHRCRKGAHPPRTTQALSVLDVEHRDSRLARHSVGTRRFRCSGSSVPTPHVIDKDNYLLIT